MTYDEVLESARGNMGPYCKVCPVCNGAACKNQMPGPGAKGVGDNAVRNYQKWQEIRVNMDTIHENKPIDTSVELFGRTFKYPFFAGPVGAMTLHYGEKYDDLAYNNLLVDACAKGGIVAFTGDGTNAKVMEGATAAIKAAGGLGIPTVKPWNLETIREKMELVKASGSFAVAMDIDGAVDELRKVAEMAGVPFIIKGIMTRRAALKAKDAGAAAIVVSNHGGRVLDQCPATAEVLEDIVEAVGGRMKILVDGGLRSGVDVFKALAMGADGVLLGRPFVTAVYGGAAEGVQCYIDKIGGELEDTMRMCGANTISDITRDMIFRA